MEKAYVLFGLMCFAPIIGTIVATVLYQIDKIKERRDMEKFEELIKSVK